MRRGHRASSPFSNKPQQKQPQEDDNESAHQDSTKLALKEIRFRGHPDTIRITKKKELDPPDTSVKKKLEERLPNDQHSSEDNDEQIYVPNKSRWLRICLDKWGVKDDDALRSQVRAAVCKADVTVVAHGKLSTVSVKQSMFPEDYEDHEKAFQVILDILSDISQLKSCGLPWFHVGYGGRNEAAYLVAQLGEDKELKLKEIGESEDLWNTIHEEVFGQYIKMPW
ncbi:uncharacterized protein LOC113324318 [Papaver somniferum]|uniref:uncharacterized protein LOC113324318 n=1 Tax=Papaver somniferum TaxID=3469 RepID=UPI000E705275|nr:uncharacterized protein LOC113324318 [Papaver somniferum]